MYNACVLEISAILVNKSVGKKCVVTYNPIYPILDKRPDACG